MKSNRADDARRLDHLVLQALRQRAVAAVQRGCPVQQVADAYGLNVRTVFRWVAMHEAAGPAALLAKPVPGRPRAAGTARSDRSTGLQPA